MSKRHDDRDLVRVCEAAEINSGERTVVQLDDVEIGVFNVDGEYYALQNTCPHRNGPVCEGKVTNALEGTWPGIGKRLEEQMTGDPAVACPWHGWEFDMATGTHLGDEQFRVPTYDAIVEDGTVYIVD